MDPLKKSLARNRPSDVIVLDMSKVPVDHLDALTESKVIRAFNTLLDQPSFFKDVDTENLFLLPEIDKLLEKAQESLAYGKQLSKPMIRVLNRALLNALYPLETVKFRAYPRFSSSSLMKIPVYLSFRPPFYGESMQGDLLNLSEGGIALLLDELIQDGALLDLKFDFPDHSHVQCCVSIRYSMVKQKKYLHGFEFNDLPDYLSKKIRNMGQDFLKCDDRITTKAAEICHMDCSFYNLCSKPQRKKPIL